MAPPESIPNSEVKHVSVDGSVGLPHVRVEHRQVPIQKKGLSERMALFCIFTFKNSKKERTVIPISPAKTETSKVQS